MKDLLYFEDIEVGVALTKSLVHEVTREEIIEFARRWDPRPFHVDESAAAESVFGRLVASSAHIFSVLSWFGTQGDVRIAALAAVGFDEVRIHHPVLPGDRLSCTATVLEKRESRSKPDRGVARTRLLLSNQEGTPVFSLIATTLIAKRPQ